MIQNSKLKALETVVVEAAKAITELGAENARLKEAKTRLETENRRLKEELRQALVSAHRQDRLKARLEKLAQRLEKIG